MPACTVIAPKGESNKAGKELKVSFNASFACARKKRSIYSKKKMMTDTNTCNKKSGGPTITLS